MRLYIDGEWNSYKGDLISMALVAEDGREWYEVLECRNPDPWVAEHVMPKLDKQPVTLDMMRESLRVFLEQFKTVEIIADWPEDIERFCGLLIYGPGLRIATPPLVMVVRRDLNSGASLKPHQALADARAMLAMDR